MNGLTVAGYHHINLARGAFEVRTRSDANPYFTLTADAPGWVRDMVMDAHDGEGPNDWRYGKIVEILEGLHECGMGAFDTPDGVCDPLSVVDMYTDDLLRWVADYLPRQEYVLDANEGEEVTSLGTIIERGQVLALEVMVQVISSAITAQMVKAAS